MNMDAELLWTGAALLLLLGTVVSLCVRCSRPAVKKSEKIYQQRGLKDKLLRFSPSLEDSASSRYLEDFSKGSRRGSNGGYILPITSDYYNWGQFQKPSEDDDDTNSYENVLICKPKDTESGAAWHRAQDASPEEPWLLAGLQTGRSGCCPGQPLSRGLPAGDEESEDYQNSASIRQWRESRRGLEQGLRDRPLSLAESPDEEPDYVNESVAATKA
ncbi:linker for activation of T-cells family member 2 isoform X3 [Suricata suricatta]|uniref:linker for activation of T-cells family member 2 isoform X3 n=1 Tax=Suricata suricatta TaxID=37032 RepID=UPI0011557A48|nr:linker for activation of T-cells family member 2 isoform X3 [Suricata suricatta]